MRAPVPRRIVSTSKAHLLLRKRGQRRMLGRPPTFQEAPSFLEGISRLNLGQKDRLAGPLAEIEDEAIAIALKAYHFGEDGHVLVR